MTERLVIIGDVHGDATRLSAMLSMPELRDRRIVLVGDFVNRGRDTRGVLDLLLRIRAERGDRLVLLAGNHELALLTYLDAGDFVMFARHGGLATIRSYVDFAKPDVHSQFVDSFPAAHEHLLRDSLLAHYETNDLLISHAGYTPAQPTDRTIETLALGSYPELFSPDRDASCSPRHLVVCGHYVQRAGRPYDTPGFICLDTGCGTLPANPLTSVLLPERVFLQV